MPGHREQGCRNQPAVEDSAIAMVCLRSISLAAIFWQS